MHNKFITQIKDQILLYKFQTLNNTKKLCSLVGCTNLITCFIFYFSLFSWKNNISNQITILFFFTLLIHLYLNFVLINWSLKFEKSKWIVWCWVSFIFIAPLGFALIISANNQKNWLDLEKTKKETKTSVFHSFTNSFIDLNQIFKDSLNYLNDSYKEEFQDFLNQNSLDIELSQEWNTKTQFLIIALHEALRQTKKKNTFDDVVFDANWYDTRTFSFAIINPKSRIMPVRYKYSLAFIVLDEFNNYQKILNAKKEIKSNLKFGPAKTICLHWGKGFKIYVNE